jgi:hypothetical protein
MLALERGVPNMRSQGERHQPPCIVAHDCINKLAAIVNHCDMLLESTEPGTEAERRIRVIRSIAEEGIEQMKQHQDDIAQAG